MAGKSKYIVFEGIVGGGKDMWRWQKGFPSW
mgnify:CR=1 FL=1